MSSMPRIVDMEYSFLGEDLKAYLEVEGRIRIAIIIKLDIPTTNDVWGEPI